MAFLEDAVLGKLTVAHSLVSKPSSVPPVGYTLGAPTTGTLTAVFDKIGPFYRAIFTLASANMPWTAASGVGAFGGLTLLTLPKGVHRINECIQLYPQSTGFISGTASLAFKVGVGSVLLAASADAALTSTSVDIGSASATITLNATPALGNSTAATKTINVSVAIPDGIATAPIIVLNACASNSTTADGSTLAVSGTIIVVWDTLYKV